jgi:hypothetical protein
MGAHASLFEKNKIKSLDRYEGCRYQSTDGHRGFTNDEVRLVIWCVATHFGVSVDKAFCYVRHESGFNEYAKNQYSSASGIFQIVDGTWSGWYWKFDEVRKNWNVKYDRFHPRNNALMALKQVRANGWGPWANFASYSC